MSSSHSDSAGLFDPGPGPALDAAQLSRLLERASAYFSLLSEPSRLRILRAVCYEELSVQQVVERTGLPQPNVSRHLTLLNRSGVLSRRRVGTSVFYAVSDPTIVELCRLVCVRLAIGLAEKG
jgi:DNA-binding transcriptional ArsR family regulator